MIVVGVGITCFLISNTALERTDDQIARDRNLCFVLWVWTRLLNALHNRKRIVIDQHRMLKQRLHHTNVFVVTIDEDHIHRTWST
jgi:hypothetical protein